MFYERKTGQNAASARVTMGSAREANQAISGLNNALLGNRRIRVRAWVEMTLPTKVIPVLSNADMETYHPHPQPLSPPSRTTYEPPSQPAPSTPDEIDKLSGRRAGAWVR
jgi:hypothetical protein